MTKRTVLLIAVARRLAVTGDGAKIRAAADLSLAEVAETVGVSVSTLWRWERGQRSPRGEAAAAWAELMADLQAQVAA